MDIHSERVAELWRYYKVGVINTIFGFGVYALLVLCHVEIYLAQILAHLLGMTFNYFMFKMHVFHGSTPSLGSYIGAYTFNYVMGLAFLALFHHFVPSPYLAGFLSILTVSTVNYFILKRFVFKISKS